MLVLWILLGALCGWIVALLTRTKTSNKITFYVLIGVTGAIAGGLLTSLLHEDTMFSAANSLFIAVVFSGMLLVLAKMLVRRA